NRCPGCQPGLSCIKEVELSDVFPVAYLETEINGEKRRFPLGGRAVCRIGRSDKNDIVLIDDLASRHHAMLQRSGDGYFYISYLGSSNGTLVNGARTLAKVTAPCLYGSSDGLSCKAEWGT